MLSYVATAASQPELVCGEKVRLIEDHIRLIQQKWTDLKSEVAYLDRRRRRARRKEREGTSTDTPVHALVKVVQRLLMPVPLQDLLRISPHMMTLLPSLQPLVF